MSSASRSAMGSGISDEDPSHSVRARASLRTVEVNLRSYSAYASIIGIRVLEGTLSDTVPADAYSESTRSR